MSLRSHVAGWCLVAIALAGQGTLSAQEVRAAPATRAPAQPAAPAGTQQRGAAPASPLQRVISLDLRRVPLRDALQAIAKQGGVTLIYSNRVVSLDRVVSVELRNGTVQTALDRVLAGTGVTFHVSSLGAVVLEKAAQAEESRADEDAATGTVFGRVTDTATAQPLANVVVSITGTSHTAMTNAQGWYILPRVPAGVRVVTARHLGYVAGEREVVITDSARVRVDFALHMSMTRLQDVVVTPTGPKRRYEVGNDVTMLDVDSIVRTQPVTSVTDLLEGRVPGLVVQHTSGAPGDPSRLRLRGVASALRSNDPIVIVDGIRVYYAQSDSTSNNLAQLQRSGSALGNDIPAPSPLDQIDPHSIATIEVMKGPSAATLYGPDAANGVIVITTKKGQAGPARWTASVSRGTSYMPGEYPDGIYRWGTMVNTGKRAICPLTQFQCQPDGEVVRFQALNDPKYTVLGHGDNLKASLGVSGGTGALTYALTGSYADETGILTLPDVEVARFQTLHGTTPPSWMRRPQTLTQWSGSSRLTARLGDHTEASLSTMLTRQTQQRSDLERELATLMRTYVDPVTGTYWVGSAVGLNTQDALIPDFYQRATDQATNFTNAASLTWRPKSWLTTSAQAGLNVVGRHDEVLLPRGMLTNLDSAGALSVGDGTSVVSTVNLNATATAPLFWGFHLQLAGGANYTRTALTQLATQVRDLAAGTTSLNGAGEIVSSNEVATDVTSFGWYLEPSFTHRRFTITTGLRIDGSSSFGSQVKLPVFPKLGLSWLLSDEPFFPFKGLFNVLRVRAAYGQAGVWPGPTDKLRLYRTSRPFLDSSLVDVNQISTLGNTTIKPERSTEIEGGFDADLLDDRLSVGITAYRKTRYDALMSVPVAPSVYGSSVSILKNIGEIRNTGLELNVSTQLVRSDPLTWSATLNLSRNHNLVTKLGKGVDPFYASNGQRIAPNYPLFGQWAKPILAYADVNGNGIIEASEVQVGDSAVFMGETVPNYEANISSTVSLFRGAVTASANLDYQDGLTQINQAMSTAAGGGGFFLRGVSDPTAPFSEQAAVAVMNVTPYGLLQTVSTLRLMSLSVAYNAPPSLAQRFGA
ncbi:MAG: TonB-dependent receptor, partial [Gemmatimonadaceae bacterium]|nr:TonB-dependent receptor [Gemmatimonadaceae bacterium]